MNYGGVQLRLGWFWHFPWNCREQIERNERLVLEDQVRELREEVSELRKLLADSRLGEVRASQAVADFLARKFMREPIFGQDPSGPTNPALSVDEMPIPKTRRQARDIVREQTQATEAQLQEILRAQREAARREAEPEPESQQL